LTAGLTGNLAHRGAFVTMRHEQALGGIKNAFAGIDGSCFCHDGLLLLNYDSYVRLNHRRDRNPQQAEFLEASTQFFDQPLR
jgi:hypothetical protein